MRQQKTTILPMLALCLLFVGCAGIRTDYVRTASYSMAADPNTELAGIFAPTEPHAAGESGVALLKYGRPSLAIRMALCERAEKSLDLQYYIWDADYSGHALSDCLVRAAKRGVRVRVLLDDHNALGKDSMIAAITGIPNLSIRAFNPMETRSKLDFLFNFSEANVRAHNKVFIADGVAAIVGGRNISDHYFGSNAESNFRDLDVLTTGAVVQDIAHVFDRFWNSEHSVPYAAFVEREPTVAEGEAAAQRLHAWMEKAEPPYDVDKDVAAFRAQAKNMAKTLIWAPVRVLSDKPEKVETEQEAITPKLLNLAEQTQKEILVENAYFVPDERLMEVIGKLRARGVRMRLLTNSLASNDVAVVYAKYAGYHETLLKSGIELYELRPDNSLKQQWSSVSSESKAGLHTKVLVADQRRVVVGSYNIDPRSAYINTELVLLIDSPEFAKTVIAYMDEGVEPSSAYKLELKKGEVVWETETEAGKPLEFDSPPQTSYWKRFVTGVMSMMPIHSQI